MKIYYYLSSYISHRNTGLDNIACLELLGHEVFTQFDKMVFDPQTADLMIFHEEPILIEEILLNQPELRQIKKIAYLVWEADIYPERFGLVLKKIDEVWTPSHYSKEAIKEHCPKSFVVPHVVQRPNVSKENVDFVKSLLGDALEDFCFLTVIDASNPRKNFVGMLEAFNLLRKKSSKKCHLLVKQYRKSLNLSTLSGVTSIDSDLSRGQMAALHTLADAYVSAHHAEGWGLGLSEAMAFGRPAIAPAFSGNLEFMNQTNSILVPCRRTLVPESMCRAIPFFTREMTWAEIEPADLANSMARVAASDYPDDLCANARKIVKKFSTKAVTKRIQNLLEKFEVNKA